MSAAHDEERMIADRLAAKPRKFTMTIEVHGPDDEGWHTAIAPLAPRLTSLREPPTLPRFHRRDASAAIAAALEHVAADLRMASR